MSDPMQVFDRALLRRRRDRAAATTAQVAPILEDAADRLLDRLDDTTRCFTRALDIGGRGIIAPRLRARGVPLVVSCDLSPRMAAGAGGLAVAADEEWLPFAPESFDLVVASLSLHWVNDLPGALLQIRDVRAGGQLLQRAGWADPVIDSRRLDVRFGSLGRLVGDLREQGLGNVLANPGPPLSRSALSRRRGCLRYRHCGAVRAAYLERLAAIARAACAAASRAIGTR